LCLSKFLIAEFSLNPNSIEAKLFTNVSGINGKIKEKSSINLNSMAREQKIKIRQA